MGALIPPSCRTGAPPLPSQVRFCHFHKGCIRTSLGPGHLGLCGPFFHKNILQLYFMTTLV